MWRHREARMLERKGSKMVNLVNVMPTAFQDHTKITNKF